MMQVAVIGTGLAGLTLARHLDDVADISLFEKSRGVGGRMARRRAGAYEFDHGAQFFTARNQIFQAFIDPLIRDGRVAEWRPRILTLAPGEKPYIRDWFETHYVAVPGMTALCKYVSRNMNIRLDTRITDITRDPQSSFRWRLHTSDSCIPETFDWVISTAPVNQTLELMRPVLNAHLVSTSGLEQVNMSPCCTLMLGFDIDLSLNFGAAKVKNMGIEWIMVNSSKPGRSPKPCLVIQSTNDWARQYQDKDDDWIIRQMLEQLQKILEKSLPVPAVQMLHRWRYASVEKSLEPDYLLDIENCLAACGDWCLYNRVEGAYLSANSLAERLKSLW
jgi:renalase